MDRCRYINRVIRRIIAIMLIGAFLLPNISFATVGIIIIEKLSPPIGCQLEEFENSYTVAAICRSIEQHVSLDNEKAINNICSWASKVPNSAIQITPGDYEIIIDIPSETLAVRYFVPNRVNMVTPYSDVTKVRTKIISPQLCRQIIYRTKALENKELFAQKDERSIEELRSEEHVFKNEGYNDESVKVKILRIDPKEVGVKLSLSKNTEERGGLQYEEVNPYRKMKSGKKLYDNKMPNTMRSDLLSLDGHAEGFKEENPGSEVFAYSGWGNIIMDGYLAGYADGKVIIRDGEDPDRVYFSVVIFSDGRIGFREIKYENDKPVDVVTKEILSDIDTNIQIGSGQSIIKDGVPIRASSIYDQFDNVKQLLHLPFFGKGKKAVHFGIDQFKADKKKLKAAVEGQSVTLKLKGYQMVEGSDIPELGDIPIDLLKVGLKEKGYSDEGISFEDEVKKRGDFFINENDRTITICFFPALNAHHFIGIDEDGYLLDIIVQGRSSRIGINLEEAGGWLVGKYKLRNAIVIDNGADPMMKYKGDLVVPSFNGRTKIASAIIYYKLKKNALYGISGSMIRKVLYAYNGVEVYLRRNLRNSLNLAELIAGRVGLDDETISTFLRSTVRHDDCDIDPVLREKIYILDAQGNADYDHPDFDIVPEEAIKDKFPGISDFELLLVKYRNRYDRFKEDLEKGIVEKNEVTPAELETLHVLLHIAEIADNFETGNDMTKKHFRGQIKGIEEPVEHFGDTMKKWLEKKYTTKYLDNIRPLEALKELIAERDPVLFETVQDLRTVYDEEGNILEVGEIDDIDEEYISELTTKTNQFEAYKRYLDNNLMGLSSILGKGKPNVLLRVPIEAIENSETENIQVFLNSFLQASNTYVEFYYMSGIGEEVPVSVYETYGVKRKPLPKRFQKTRSNTVTLFSALKGEELTDVTIRMRLGDLNMKITDTILSPIGLQNDLAGLVRSTVLGLRIMGFARELAEDESLENDPKFLGKVQLAVMEIYKQVCDPSDRKELAGLTPQDIIALATGDTINDILVPLRKLVKLLPIMPIDTEELKRIYEHARQVLLAA